MSQMMTKMTIKMPIIEMKVHAVYPSSSSSVLTASFIGTPSKKVKAVSASTICTALNRSYVTSSTVRV